MEQRVLISAGGRLHLVHALHECALSWGGSRSSSPWWKRVRPFRTADIQGLPEELKAGIDKGIEASDKEAVGELLVGVYLRNPSRYKTLSPANR
jgi:hypothetical protein